MARSEGAGALLTRKECDELLRRCALGRLVFADRSTASMAPVRYVLDGGDIYFGTGTGSRLTAAVRRAVVALHVDVRKARAGAPANVVVVGVAEVVRDPQELARLRVLLAPWPHGGHRYVVRIRPTVVTGRLLPPTAAAG